MRKLGEPYDQDPSASPDLSDVLSSQDKRKTRITTFFCPFNERCEVREPHGPDVCNWRNTMPEDPRQPDPNLRYEEVDHPSHYGGKDDPYETIKVIQAWGFDTNWYRAEVLRYISRAGKKPGQDILLDLEKAVWYILEEMQQIKRRRGL